METGSTASNRKKLDWRHIESRLLEHYGKYGEQGTVPEMLKTMHEIDDVRHNKNGVLLAHYYQRIEIQLLADRLGDSLALAQTAKDDPLLKDAGIIVSSTVHFMAEMVKLLVPEKKVVIPDLEASCSIAEGINGASVRAIRSAFPGSGIIAYINTAAETKAEVDAVCTSGNAREVVQNIPNKTVILLPDHYFAKNIFSTLESKDNGKTYLVYHGVKNDNLVMYDVKREQYTLVPIAANERPKLDKGTCIVHENFTDIDVLLFREEERERGDPHGGLVLAHPEVHPVVAALSDMVGGTKKMIDYIKTTDAKRILYLTECDLASPLIEAYPEREFVTSCKLCPYMKKNNLGNVLRAFREETYAINIEPHIAEGARRSLERMFILAPTKHEGGYGP